MQGGGRTDRVRRDGYPSASGARNRIMQGMRVCAPVPRPIPPNCRGPPVHAYKPDGTTAALCATGWAPRAFPLIVTSRRPDAPDWPGPSPSRSRTAVNGAACRRNGRKTTGGKARRFAGRVRAPGWSAIQPIPRVVVGWGRAGNENRRDFVEGSELWAQLTPPTCLRGRALAQQYPTHQSLLRQAMAGSCSYGRI
jgi:hypothetical protein